MERKTFGLITQQKLGVLKIMSEPIIAKITDPESGQVELLQEAQALIEQRDGYKRALENALMIDFEGDRRSSEAVKMDAQLCYHRALKQLEAEKINSGKVS
jgi:hypothetical protein